MNILGRRLIGPNIAGIALCLYGGVYGVLLVLLSVGAPFEPLMTLAVVGMLAMAVTPFVAVVHLVRAATPDVGPPARPITMAVVMAVPTIFWLYTFFDSVDFGGIFRQDDWLFALVFALIPGLLSLWLVVAFVLLARRDRRIP